MKIELKDRDITLIDRIAEKTGYDYLSNIDTKNYMEVDFLLDILSDLESAYIDLEEKLERYINEVDANYIPRKGTRWEYGE